MELNVDIRGGWWCPRLCKEGYAVVKELGGPAVREGDKDRQNHSVLTAMTLAEFVAPDAGCRASGTAANCRAL
jgi:hypothetical protein